MTNSFPLVSQLGSLDGNCVECCAEEDSEMISQGEVLRLMSNACHWHRRLEGCPEVCGVGTPGPFAFQEG